MIGLCASWAVNFLFEWNSLVFLLIHMLAWFLSDYTLLKIVQVNLQFINNKKNKNNFLIINFLYNKKNSKMPFTKFEYVVSWLYRETICYYLFLQAAVDPTVQWRHGKYRLKWGGLAEEIKSSPVSSVGSSSANTSVNMNNSKAQQKVPLLLSTQSPSKSSQQHQQQGAQTQPSSLAVKESHMRKHQYSNSVSRAHYPHIQHSHNKSVNEAVTFFGESSLKRSLSSSTLHAFLQSSNSNNNNFTSINGTNLNANTTTSNSNNSSSSTNNNNNNNNASAQQQLQHNLIMMNI